MFLGYEAVGSLVHCWLASIWKNLRSIYTLWPSNFLSRLYSVDTHVCIQNIIVYGGKKKKKKNENNGSDYQKGTGWVNERTHSCPSEWNVANGKKGNINVHWYEKLQDTPINEQNMVESHILKGGGAHTQKLLYTEYFWKDIQENSVSVPSEV